MICSSMFVCVFVGRQCGWKKKSPYEGKDCGVVLQSISSPLPPIIYVTFSSSLGLRETIHYLPRFSMECLPYIFKMIPLYVLFHYKWDLVSHILGFWGKCCVFFPYVSVFICDKLQ